MTTSESQHGLLLPYPDYSTYALNSPESLFQGARTFETLKEDLDISDTSSDSHDEQDAKANVSDTTIEYLIDSDSSDSETQGDYVRTKCKI